MRAKVKSTVIAASDDIVAEGGYAYFPLAAARMELLTKSPRSASDRECPHRVQFYDAVVDGVRYERAAWIYEAPRETMRHVAGRIGFWRDVVVE